MKNIYVTKPFLLPIDEYYESLKEVWENGMLTNVGPFHDRFENALAEFLELPFVSLINNATTGLMIALKALEFENEGITTPFSFIATSNSIKWYGLEPVFSDTDSHVGNLLLESVKNKISIKTGGILDVHNYAIPGDLE